MPAPLHCELNTPPTTLLSHAPCHILPSNHSDRKQLLSIVVFQAARPERNAPSTQLPYHSAKPVLYGPACVGVSITGFSSKENSTGYVVTSTKPVIASQIERKTNLLGPLAFFLAWVRLAVTTFLLANASFEFTSAPKKKPLFKMADAIDRPADRPTDRSIDRPTDRPTERPTDRPAERPESTYAHNLTVLQMVFLCLSPDNVEHDDLQR